MRMTFIDFGGHLSDVKATMGIIYKCGVSGDATLCVVIFELGSNLAILLKTICKPFTSAIRNLFMHFIKYYAELFCIFSFVCQFACILWKNTYKNILIYVKIILISTICMMSVYMHDLKYINTYHF